MSKNISNLSGRIGLKNNLFENYSKGLTRSLWNIATPYTVGTIVRFDEGLWTTLTLF